MLSQSMNQKIKVVKKLRTAGFSLREISSKLNVPYSTVRKYCKAITMTKKGKKRYGSKVNGVTKYIKIKQVLTNRKIRLMSNLLFDGAVYKTNYTRSMMYVNSSEELIKEFIEDMKVTFR